MKNTQSRRKFIKTCAAAGVFATLPGLAFAAPSRKKHYSETKLLLGTFVNITVASDSAERASQAIAASFAEITRMQDIFNRHDKSSPLSALNHTGKLADSPLELVSMTARALNIGRELQGAFDISVAPLVDLIRSSRGVPERKELAEASALADAGAVRIDGNSIALQKSGMALTFDGIAKGAIADAASKTLLAHGCPDHMVDAGGDIMARGVRHDGLAWKVGVRNPADESSVLAATRLHDRAVATSGIYENSSDRSGRLHHLVHPQSGVSQPWFASVSVIAPNACYADALATALSAMPPAQAMSAVNALPGCAALFLHTDGSLVRSARWV